MQVWVRLREIAVCSQVLVGVASTSSSSMALRHSVQRQTVIGLMRDLRGIAQATSSKRTYSEP